MFRFASFQTFVRNVLARRRKWTIDPGYLCMEIKLILPGFSWEWQRWIVLLVIMRAIYIYSLYLTIILRSEINILLKKMEEIVLRNKTDKRWSKVQIFAQILKMLTKRFEGTPSSSLVWEQLKNSVCNVTFKLKQNRNVYSARWLWMKLKSTLRPPGCRVQCLKIILAS